MKQGRKEARERMIKSRFKEGRKHVSKQANSSSSSSSRKEASLLRSPLHLKDLSWKGRKEACKQARKEGSKEAREARKEGKEKQGRREGRLGKMI